MWFCALIVDKTTKREIRCSQMLADCTCLLQIKTQTSFILYKQVFYIEIWVVISNCTYMCNLFSFFFFVFYMFFFLIKKVHSHTNRYNDATLIYVLETRNGHKTSNRIKYIIIHILCTLCAIVVRFTFCFFFVCIKDRYCSTSWPLFYFFLN